MHPFACLAVCFVFSIPAGVAAQEFVPPGKKAAGEKAAEKPEKKPPYLLSMRVVDATGTPLEGAGLGVCHGDFNTVDAGVARNEPVAKSGADGRLTVRVEPDEKNRTYFFLSFKGKECLRLTPRTTKKTVKGEAVLAADFGVIVLRDGLDLSGLIRSKDGKPVVGARVQATDVTTRMMNRNSNRSMSGIGRFTSGVSNERGIVRLYGVPKFGVSIVISAKGYHPKRIGYVNRHVPLVATLEPGGEIVGQVVDADGKPVKDAMVRTYSEEASTGLYKRTKEDGMFRMSVPGRGRYRLYYYAKLDGARNAYRWSKVLEGPQSGVVLKFDDAVKADQVAAAKGIARATKIVKRAGPGPKEGAKKGKKAKRGLVVKIVDDKGARVPEVKATVVWWAPNMWQHNSGYIERQLHSASAIKTDTQSQITLAKPSQGQPNTGRVMVVAKGFAPSIVKDIEWDEEKRANEIVVRLATESVIHGSVVDEQGKPVAGAAVFVTPDPSLMRNYVPPPMRRKLSDQQGHVKTDEKGAFEFRSLGRGTHFVYVGHPKRADVEPIEVELKDDEPKITLKVPMPKGASIFGKLVGAKPKLGWRVRINRMQAQNQNHFRSYHGLNVDQASEFAPVQEDGTFEIHGLTRANYDLSLIMPGSAGEVIIPVEPLRVRSKDVRREFDISEEMPGRLEGRVTVRGAALPPGRLMLLATNAKTQVMSHYSNRANYIGQQVVVEPSGKFGLDLPEGKYRIQLVDLQTAVLLYQGIKTVRVHPTKTTKTDIEVELASATVKLVPETEGQQVRIARIEIRATHPPLPGQQNRGMVFGGSDGYRGVGLEIEPGTTEARLVLPCVPIKLLVRSDAHNLDPKMHAYNFPAQGEAELEPTTGKSNKIEIRVAEPQIDVTNDRR